MTKKNPFKIPTKKTKNKQTIKRKRGAFSGLLYAPIATYFRCRPHRAYVNRLFVRNHFGTVTIDASNDANLRDHDGVQLFTETLREELITSDAGSMNDMFRRSNFKLDANSLYVRKWSVTTPSVTVMCMIYFIVDGSET